MIRFLSLHIVDNMKHHVLNQILPFIHKPFQIYYDNQEQNFKIQIIILRYMFFVRCLRFHYFMNQFLIKHTYWQYITLPDLQHIFLKFDHTFYI